MNATDELCDALEAISSPIAAAIAMDAFVLKALIPLAPNLDEAEKERMLELTAQTLDLAGSGKFTREDGATPANEVIANVIGKLSGNTAFLMQMYVRILAIVLPLAENLEDQQREKLLECGLQIRQLAASLSASSVLDETSATDEQLVKGVVALHGTAASVLEMHATTLTPILPVVLGPAGRLDPDLAECLFALHGAAAAMRLFIAPTNAQ